MVRPYLFLISLLSLVFAGCAEIVPLTGGDEDTTSPKVITQAPEQGATNYSGNTIIAEFNEYVKLNDPNSTLTINPATVKVKSTLERRTLTLSWDKALQENTTYIIQLDGTVRDINEQNDSIMQFVFSTGPFIDSLTITGKISGAYNNTALAQATVGLYHPDSNVMRSKPLYATRSNIQGNFTFSNLKPGNYKVLAFTDVNKDRIIQADEQVGFASETVSSGDTLPVSIRSFKPLADKKNLRIDILAPGAALIYNLDSLEAEKLTVNAQKVKVLQQFRSDSLLIALPENTGTNYSFLYDTVQLNKAVTAVERAVKPQISQELSNGKWRKGDTLFFKINDLIKSADTSAIKITDQKGKAVSYSLLQPRLNSIALIPDPELIESFSVRFEKNALKGQTSATDSIQFSYTTLLKADLGNLVINCKGFEGQWIIELTQNEKAVYSAVKDSGDSLVAFQNIVPGTYNVRCIRDVNRNGKWDTGNVKQNLQPEIIERYTLKQKMRPNWDIEETIIHEE